MKTTTEYWVMVRRPGYNARPLIGASVRSREAAVARTRNRAVAGSSASGNARSPLRTNQLNGGCEMATLLTYGVSEIAARLGVTTSAMSNWQYRSGGHWPVEPAVAIISGHYTYYGWTKDQMEEWRQWKQQNVRKRTRRSRQVTG